MAEEKVSQRRLCRVACIQYVYSWSINQPDNLADNIRLFFDDQEHERDYYSFAEELIHGILDNLDTIDERIQELANNWEFDRIAKIDLAILRMAIFELLFRKDIPPVVTINEAVDLSKEFSSAESKRFVNGILDKVKGKLDRPARKASWDVDDV
ncbi:transcription antitermination factor NusB [Puniceicoccaceae bacterium K14]|nr:transcription antitermination factor NusB [Puniceicoccaceae bacterium K14]